MSEHQNPTVPMHSTIFRENPHHSIIVRDLPFSCTTADLRDLCIQLSGVTPQYAYVQCDGQQKSLHYGYLMFEDEADVPGVVASMNGHRFLGRDIQAARFVSSAPNQLAKPAHIHIFFRSTRVSLPRVTEETLRTFLERYGELSSVVICDYGLSKERKQEGFGFVSFRDPSVHERVVAEVRHKNFEHVTFDCSWSKRQKKTRSPEGEIEAEESVNQGGNSSDDSASSPRPHTSGSPNSRPTQRRPSEDTMSSSPNMGMAYHSLGSTSRGQDAYSVHHIPGIKTNLPPPTSPALTPFQPSVPSPAPLVAYYPSNPHVYQQQQQQGMTVYQSPRNNTLPLPSTPHHPSALPSIFLHQQPSQPHNQQVPALPLTFTGVQSQYTVGLPSIVQSNEAHPPHRFITPHPHDPFNAQAQQHTPVVYALHPPIVGSHLPQLPQSESHHHTYHPHSLQSQPQQYPHQPASLPFNHQHPPNFVISGPFQPASDGLLGPIPQFTHFQPGQVNPMHYQPPLTHQMAPQSNLPNLPTYNQNAQMIYTPVMPPQQQQPMPMPAVYLHPVPTYSNHNAQPFYPPPAPQQNQGQLHPQQQQHAVIAPAYPAPPFSQTKPRM